MKKLFALLLIVLLTFSFFACGSKGECEACGETASLKKLTVMGESAMLCGDCYSYAKATADYFGM